MYSCQLLGATRRSVACGKAQDKRGETPGQLSHPSCMAWHLTVPAPWGCCLGCKAGDVRWLPGSFPAHSSQTPGLSVLLQMRFALCYTNRKELQLPQERRGNYWWLRDREPDVLVIFCCSTLLLKATADRFSAFWLRSSVKPAAERELGLALIAF